ncbi:Uncharacterized protein FWK35_00025364, partial [Aphis craccivora]
PQNPHVRPFPLKSGEHLCVPLVKACTCVSPPWSGHELPSSLPVFGYGQPPEHIAPLVGWVSAKDHFETNPPATATQPKLERDRHVRARRQLLCAAGFPHIPKHHSRSRMVSTSMVGCPDRASSALSLRCDPTKIWDVYRGFTVDPYRAALAAGAVAATPELEVR